MLRDENGFSLVEILVVVAMIAILAAIALPQFTAYAVQGYNATAAADCRNAASAEKTFFAEWGVYASSAPGASAGAGMVLTSSVNSTGRIWATSINGTAPSVTIPEPGFSVSMSQYVGIIISTSAGGGSYTIVAKNASGDRCFGMDSDAREVYWVNAWLGQSLSDMSANPATPGVNDFSGVAGSGSCSDFRGQFTWVAI